MQFSLSNSSNFNTLFVGTPHDNSNNNMGGNLFFGDPASFSPQVIDYVMSRFGVRSVLDVGSGLGHTPQYIASRYHVPVIGIEGLPFNVQNAVYPLCYHDLTKGPFICGPVDLVTCVEVVEHIDPKYLDFLLTTLTRGRLLLMTHAVPGQNGAFHVNEQPSEYWIEKLQSRGFGLLALDTHIIRNLSASEKHCPGYFAQSGLLFGRLPVAPASTTASAKTSAAAQAQAHAQAAAKASASENVAETEAETNPEDKGNTEQK